ncbi:Crp/Fnr family transcriptional regulator [Hymenobacter glaciei]|uniref:Crp/Fnr family transcriptional regulator n=1 Tax=Hymenobacter glaciei TaxID=877209 RepID=A0ABP7UUU3_9BACT
MNTSPLLQFISRKAPLSAPEEALLTRLFKPVRLEKNAVLEQENRPAGQLYYIHQGFVRISSNEDGRDITTQLMGGPGFITCFTSFMSGKPSQESLIAITGCDAYSITKADYLLLHQQSPNWKHFCQRLYEQAIAFGLQRTKDMLTLPAEKRYRKLLTAQPELIRYVPLQYIASYIGIKPESLSRIRKKVIF